MMKPVMLLFLLYPLIAADPHVEAILAAPSYNAAMDMLDTIEGKVGPLYVSELQAAYRRDGLSGFQVGTMLDRS